MKFKSKEDLIKESDIDYGFSDQYEAGMRIGINKAFTSISERIAFYEKYKDKPKLFTKENDFCFFGNAEGYVEFKNAIEEDQFNDWLFRFCFDGVK